ncbi:MAG: reductase, partial [Solirubrobacteraceae bacterium]
ARLVLACARRPGARVLNSADPGLPTAEEVVRAIAVAAGRPVDVVGLGEDAAPELGWTPWGSWPPFLLDASAGGAVGYEPAGSHAETVTATVDELVGLTVEQRRRLDRDPWFEGRFDYRLDDLALGAA